MIQGSKDIQYKQKQYKNTLSKYYMSTNPQNDKIYSPIFKGNYELNKQRKYSAQVNPYSEKIQGLKLQEKKNSIIANNKTQNLNQNKQEEGQNKMNDISGLDVSQIQKKPSQVSETSRKDYIGSSPPFSGILNNRKQISPHKADVDVHVDEPSKKVNIQVPKKPNIHVQTKLKDENIKKMTQFKRKKENDSQQQQQIRQDLNLGTSISWSCIWQFIKLILFSYQFNLIEYLKSIDKQKAEQTVDLVKIAPGYKAIQYVYVFYMLKHGILIGMVAALLYPLPYSFFFLMITIDLQVPFVAIFMLAGMRSGAIALLLKYCLHFPKYAFHWIVLIFTIFIGCFLPNNYIYMLLFLISIFLSFYINQGPRNSLSRSDSQHQVRNTDDPQSALIMSTFGLNFNQEQIYKQYKVVDRLPDTHPNTSIFLISFTFILLWVLDRYFQNRQLSIFGQIFPMSLLVSSKEMLAFFPYLYKQVIVKSTLSFDTLISLTFLFPGPHLKAFMFFIYHNQIDNAMIGYLCLYAPAIFLTNVFIGYRHYFYTKTYYNIRQSIQAVSNGVVFCLVFWMLDNQKCFFNSVCYSAVVIMVVAKLYKLRQLFAITFGIFLISTRTIILNINKGISFQKQACLQ